MSQSGQPASEDKTDKLADIDTRLFNSSVRKAIEVLEAFNGGAPEQTIGQLTSATGADRSSVQRAVYTLQKMGYLKSDPETRRYRVSERMMDMSFAFLRADRMVEAALSPLALLSERTGDSVHLSRMSGFDIVYLLRWPTGMQQHFASLPGRRLPAFCTSGGRAMLSLWPREAMIEFIQKAPIQARTAKTTTDPDDLINMIDAARERGFARSDGECLIGETALSVPVLYPGFEQSGAALHVTFSADKYTEAEIEKKIIPPLKNAGQMLSQMMNR